MTKKVVDLNYLQNPDLARFLRAHPGNRVVLTDYLAMESYNSSDPRNSLRHYLEWLAPYANQALVLKGTRQVARLSFKRKGMQKRLVDESHTKRFPQFCGDIGQIVEGDRGYDHWLSRSHQAARAHLDGAMLQEPLAIEDAMAAFRELWTLSELKELRTQGIVVNSILPKLADHVPNLAAVLIRNHRDKPIFPPQFSDMVNTYAFRLALAFYMRTALRFSTGAEATVNPPNHRNDTVDCSYVAYATFFDGLLTSDRKLKKVCLLTQEALNAFTRT
jgi:hypothetical protein